MDQEENKVRESVVEEPVAKSEVAAPAEPVSEPFGDGEYHYKNGYTQKIYSDAHYEPAEESTVPPRYYTPPEKHVKEPKAGKEKLEKPEKKKGSGFLKFLCVALIFAILCAAGGAYWMNTRYEARFAALEGATSQLEEARKADAEAAAAEAAAAEASGAEAEEAGGLVSAAALTTISDVMAPSDIYEQAKQQVVGISTEITYTNFFGMTSSGAVSGSGFIISDDGYILTNYHVVEDAHKGNYDINVMLYDGTTYLATIVGFEESNDIAILKIDAEELNPATLADSNEIKVGDTVYAVGNPLGELEFSMSTGHISALDRVITTEENESINMFQIDAAVNEGNSGGPLYNNKGEVIGIVAAKYASSGVEGLGFAIPINDAANIANDLITKGYVTGKPYMGVELDSRYNSMYSQYYNMPLGAYVANVVEGSAAEKAGLEAGDIITELGGYTLESYTDLKQAVRHFSAFDTVDMTVYRAGEEMHMSITFDEAVPDTVTVQSEP